MINQIVRGEFTNCVWVEPFLVNGNGGLELRLTISFATLVVKTYIGKFEIGLRRGDFRIALKGALARLENRWPVHEINSHQEVQRIVRTSSQGDATTTGGATGSARFNPGVAGVEIKGETQKKFTFTSGIEESYKVVQARIRTEGPPEAPCWVFRAVLDEPTIEGELRRQLLARLDRIGDTVTAVAGFDLLFDKDVCVLDCEGILTRFVKLSRFASMEAKQKGMIRGLVRKMIARRFRDHLTDVELRLTIHA